MWIISYHTSYYPWIEKFKTYQEAIERYDELKKNIVDESMSSYDDECVFLSKVEDYTMGKDYVLYYE